MIKYVTTNLVGGLGNQLFQIAASVGHALRTNRPYGICYELPFHAGQGHSPERYKDNLYRDILSISSEEIGETGHVQGAFHYNQIPDDVDGTLRGYYQSPLFFEGFDEEIKSLFRNGFPSETVNRVNLFLDPIRSSGKIPVAVHIRRGEYCALKDHHPILPEEYYIEAQKIFNKKYYDCEFILCTDSIGYPYPEADNTIEFNNVRYKLFSTDYNNELDDLYMMSQCEGGAIIANSSFSWWGAFLGSNKHVVAPKTWFGPKAPQDYHDIYFKHWIQL